MFMNYSLYDDCSLPIAKLCEEEKNVTPKNTQVFNNMSEKQITINKEWLTGLVELVDKLYKEDNFQRSFILKTHLLGYVHSLDEYLK